MSLFVAGLVSGFTHCMAMCGPFVISQTKGIEKMREAALLPYHFGRLSTYVFLSILIYSVLNLVFLYLPVRSYLIAPILMTAGFIFLINAFPNLSKFFKWAGVIKISLPYRLVSGFMPCGMVTSALMASATAPTVMKAAIAMAAFGAGTIPALMMTAFGGQALRLKYPSAMPYVTRGMMIWSSASLFIIAGMLLI